jgi:hypothetical protein
VVAVSALPFASVEFYALKAETVKSVGGSLAPIGITRRLDMSDPSVDISRRGSEADASIDIARRLDMSDPSVGISRRGSEADASIDIARRLDMSDPSVGISRRGSEADVSACQTDKALR